MENNLDTAHFVDLCSDLAQHIESKGARLVLLEFSRNYPDHYNQLVMQINRGMRQEAALLKNNVNPV